MDPNLAAKKDKVIDLINNLEDDNFALLLLIHISRYQNLFLHTEPDWSNSPNNWITKDRRLQDESIGVLSFIILFSLTNAHVDENLFPEYRKQIKAMKLEDFLDNNFFITPFTNFIGKKISLKVLEAFFSIPRENIRRNINSLIEAGFITKDKKYGYLVNMEAYVQYIFTDSLSKIMKSLMRTFDDIIVNLEEKYQLKLNLKPISSINLEKVKPEVWNRIRLPMYHFWVRVLTLEGSDRVLSPNDRVVLSASIYFRKRKGILNFANISELYENDYLLPTNISSIAEASRMPRETVRRCSNKLIKMGHFEKKGRQLFRTNYAHKDGEIASFIKNKAVTTRDMMNFYFRIYEDLAQI
jgi:predicted transcriptional regulator